jgi:hypothetical protein
VSYFKDTEFRQRILALMMRDRKFLRKLSGKLTPQDFARKPQDGSEGWAIEWVGWQTLKYWKEYRQPIGGLLKTFALDWMRANPKKTSKQDRKALLTLIETLKDPELGVAVEAIQEKVLKYKERQYLRSAVEELIESQEKGELEAQTFRQIAARALTKVDFDDKITNYADTLDRRIRRRQNNQEEDFPLLYIECFDQVMRTIPRGQVGLVLAPYKIGKSAFMAHLAKTYAMQEHGTILFTLEDPESLVEDRLDASLCGVTLASLSKDSEELRKRWKKAWENMRANIFLVDATGGGWSIQRMMEVADNLRNRGEKIDCILIDYDEQVESLGKYTGEHSMRMKSNEIWLDAVRWAARDDYWLWMAAQATINKEATKKVLSGEDQAEDKGKIRKVGIGLGVGLCPSPKVREKYTENARWLQIIAHRFGRSRVGWPIVGDFECGVFFDTEASREAQKMYKEEQAAKNKNA